MSTTISESGRKPLAERLVQEALLIVAEAGGPHSLSLREVQRRAEVSPAAAYRHFANRVDLIQAVAEEAAGLLADALASAVEESDAAGSETPRSRLRAACEAYIEFATSNPGLYRTIYYSDENMEQLTAPSDRAQGDAGDGGYNMLIHLLEAVVAPTELHSADPIAVWSGLHGLALLRLDAALRFATLEQFTTIRDRVLQTLVAAIPVDTLTHTAN